MKLINSKYEIINPVSYNIDGILKHIELCGRVSYKSEDKITPDSSTKFVDRIIKSGHMSVLEHGTAYLKLPTGLQLSDKYKKNKYSIITLTPGIDPYWAVTTNYRVLVENNWLDDLKYICEPSIFHEKRITVKFTMDRIGSQSFCRHRHFSFIQESTRYCNYSKDKFGDQIEYIIPTWTNLPEIELKDSIDVRKFTWGDVDKEIEEAGMCEPKISKKERIFLHSLKRSEDSYMGLIAEGCKPQEARQVLPNALKTEIIMTGFESDWEGFFKLRDDSHAHPDAYKLAHPLHDEFIKLGYARSRDTQNDPEYKFHIFKSSEDIKNIKSINFVNGILHSTEVPKAHIEKLLGYNIEGEDTIQLTQF